MDPQNKQEAISDLKKEGLAAAQALAEAALAAAQKPGFKTSEFFATAVTIGISGVTALASDLSKVPGPWQIVAAAIGTGLAVTAVYGWHRTSLKAAAMAAAGESLKAATSGAPVAPKPTA